MQPADQNNSSAKSEDFLKETHAILERIKTQPHYRASAEEIEILLRSEQSESTRKFAILSLFKADRFAEAIPFAWDFANRELTEENLKNLWVILLRVKDRDGLLKVAAKAEGIVAPIDYHSLMTSTYTCLHRFDEAIRHGDLCLQARDEKFAGGSSVPDALILPKFNRNAVSRNVISYSVFDSDERYLKGAENNSIAARYVYPA